MNEQAITYVQTILQVDISMTIFRNSQLQMFHKINVLQFLPNSQENICAIVSKNALKFS